MRFSIALRVMLTVLGLTTFALPVNVHAQSFSLKGTWNGHYSYSDNRTSVDFTLDLDAGDGRCLGRTKEPNTFGDKSAIYLYANVSCLSTGVRPAGEFRFHKQYDGTGNVSHEVEYSGIVSSDGNTVTGNWLILSSTSWSIGQFSMSRAK